MLLMLCAAKGSTPAKMAQGAGRRLFPWHFPQRTMAQMRLMIAARHCAQGGTQRAMRTQVFRLLSHLTFEAATAARCRRARTTRQT